MRVECQSLPRVLCMLWSTGTSMSKDSRARSDLHLPPLVPFVGEIAKGDTTTNTQLLSREETGMNYVKQSNLILSLYVGQSLLALR